MENKKIEPKDLPLVSEVLAQLVRPGTVLMYPEKQIIFHSSPQAVVKTLSVNICSTETTDMSALHKIHTKIRNSQ